MSRVQVRFESENTFNSYCEEVAIFENEEMYNICIPALEAYAAQHEGMILTESIMEDEEVII